MASQLRTLGSSVGSKILIGSTGLLLLIYLAVHIAGNLLVFLGPTIFNTYSAALLTNPLIPVIEVGLLAIVLLHIFMTIRMYLVNLQARPVSYVQKRSAGRPSRKSFASSTMIFSGLWLLVFVIIHVNAFKYGTVYRASNGERDLYRLEMENFSNPLTVGFYIITMLVVGSHLWHGVLSGFQSLGVQNPSDAPRALRTAKVVAVAIAGGFIIIALWAYLTGGVRA
jgi:succinate dehydrogenase / fumarate reductase, cytochrome b subunit